MPLSVRAAASRSNCRIRLSTAFAARRLSLLSAGRFRLVAWEVMVGSVFGSSSVSCSDFASLARAFPLWLSGALWTRLHSDREEIGRRTDRSLTCAPRLASRLAFARSQPVSPSRLIPHPLNPPTFKPLRRETSLKMLPPARPSAHRTAPRAAPTLQTWWPPLCLLCLLPAQR